MLPISPKSNDLYEFLRSFDFNRDIKGIQLQLDQNLLLNSMLRTKSEIFNTLNKSLQKEDATKNLFLEELEDASIKITESTKQRFDKFIGIIKDKNDSGALLPTDDENNHENNFFSVDNIKKIFVDFAKHREQLENPKLKERTANGKIELYDSRQDLNDAQKRNLAKDAIKDCYKMLAIFYFGGVYSAKDLDNNLKELQSMEHNLDEDVINPGWFDIFSLLLLHFIYNVFRGFEEIFSFQEIKDVASELKRKSVFEKIKQTAQTLHENNTRE